jgi:CBS domain-containing protein
MMNTIKSLLKSKGSQVWTVGPQATVYEAIELLAEKNIGALLVMEGEQVCGIFSERDYVRKVAIKGRVSKDTEVQEIMTKDIIHVNLDTTIDECMALMTESRIRHLPILDDTKLQGMISIGDLVKAIMREQKRTIEQLGEYINS